MLGDGRTIRVGVGSGNPVKRRAVASVLPEAAVSAVPVESGVSEQPRGHAETVAGAENRARRVLESGSFDYGVGIEGGVAEYEGTDGLYLVMWAAVTDGAVVGHGTGPSLELPADIAARIRDGEELGPVMDDVLGVDDVAKKDGAAGAFTRGRLPRDDALAAAVTAALAPFASDLYD